MVEQLELIPQPVKKPRKPRRTVPRLLTDRQRQILNYITDYIAEHERPPSVGDIARHFEFLPGAAADHVNALVKKGYLLKEPGVMRGLRLPKNNANV